MHFHNSIFFVFNLQFLFIYFFSSKNHCIVKHVLLSQHVNLDLPFLPKLSFHKLIIHLKGSYVFGNWYHVIINMMCNCICNFAVMTNSGSTQLFSFESNAIHSLDRSYFDQSMHRVLTTHNHIVHMPYVPRCMQLSLINFKAFD